MNPLKIALVASEAAPFAKTGGLADVVSALARALHRQGHDVRVFLPLYGRLNTSGIVFTAARGLQDLSLEFPGGKLRYSVRTAPLPNSTNKGADGPLQVEFIDCPELYQRESFYTDEADEPVRWATLTRAVIEVCQHTAWAPDIVHCNDWHTGLMPLYLKEWYGWDELFSKTRTLLSIHNIGYQGTFPASVIEQLGLEEARELFHQEHLQDGYVSFLEMGLLHADWLSTVSCTYAQEIQGEEYGMGLEGLLQARDDHLEGIVNGIDVEEWDPSSDPLLPHAYSAADLGGKSRMKASLLERMGLPLPDGRGAMLVGIIARMTGQKGFELLPDILPVLLRRDDFQLVVLGSGEESHENYFKWLQETYPDKVAIKIGYDNELSHWIEAGSDLFLMPSRYEPCGLNQMYSLRYGCVPLVRATGGLADTVEAWNGERASGTGFVFQEFTSEALFQALSQALEIWQDQQAWDKLVQNGMAQDFSWEQQAAHYVELYRRILQD